MTNLGPAGAPPPCSLSGQHPPARAADKIKRALKLLFGAAEVSVYEVAGEQWVSPDQLSGRAQEELRRAVKGKAKVGEPAPAPPGGPVGLAHDSAWSIHQQQQRQGPYQQPPAGEGQGLEERLRQAAATVLSAGCPSVVQTIDQVYCAPAAGGSSSGAPSPRSRGLSDREQGVELAAVVTHGGHGTEPASYVAGPGPSSSCVGGSSNAGGSGAWDASLGLSSSGAWGYAPEHCSGSGAAAGPSGGSSGAACSSGSSGW